MESKLETIGFKENFHREEMLQKIKGENAYKIIFYTYI